MRERKHEEIARTLPGYSDATLDVAAEAIEAAMDDDLGDELLGLIFTACHPMLSPDARAALTLQVVGGLTTDAEIARAFLGRAKDCDRAAYRPREEGNRKGRITFEVPRGAERAARLPSVLEVIYLIFNEGYAATLYDRLARRGGLAVVELNRAIAHSMPSGPTRASDWWTRSPTPPPCATTRHCRRRGATFCSGPVDWPGAFGIHRSATLTRNARERAFLLARADACDCKH